jgi:hypothetical protein
VLPILGFGCFYQAVHYHRIDGQLSVAVALKKDALAVGRENGRDHARVGGAVALLRLLDHKGGSIAGQIMFDARDLLNRQLNMAMVFISHDLLSVASLCARIAICSTAALLKPAPLSRCLEILGRKIRGRCYKR